VTVKSLPDKWKHGLDAVFIQGAVKHKWVEGGMFKSGKWIQEASKATGLDGNQNSQTEAWLTVPFSKGAYYKSVFFYHKAQQIVDQ